LDRLETPLHIHPFPTLRSSDLLAERDAGALDPGREVGEAPAELEQEPRLAEPRVADHEDRLAPPAPGLRPRALERRERVVAPHERRQTMDRARGETRDGAAGAQQFPGGDGPALALPGDGPEGP